MFNWTRTKLQLKKSKKKTVFHPPDEMTEEEIRLMNEDIAAKDRARLAAIREEKGQRKRTKSEGAYDNVPLLEGVTLSLNDDAEAAFQKIGGKPSGNLVARMLARLSEVKSTKNNLQVDTRMTNNVPTLFIRMKKNDADGDDPTCWYRDACALSFSGKIHQATVKDPPYLYIDRLDAERGNCRPFFCDLLDVAQELGISLLKLEATETGRYAWIRYGFRPTQESWDNLRKAALVRLIDLGDSVPEEVAAQAREYLCDNNPDAIEQVADLRTELILGLYDEDQEEDENKRNKTTVGFHLVSSIIWKGAFDLSNEEALEKVKAYIGYYS